ncbi:MAG TPA: YdcF family protein [Stellaceae bacterium]|jgi:uncharacterized SAM-binding protein YcdF (DUF218 family)
MSHLITTSFLIPPAVFVWLILLGIWLSLRHAPLGPLIALVGSLALYATSMPLVASFLLERLEEHAALSADLTRAQAIVVLGGGLRRGDPGEKDLLKYDSLDRLVMAVQAYRLLHIPIVVTGAGREDGPSEAALMKQMLDTDFSIPVTWVEPNAHTTYENALFTRRLLQPAGVHRVVVVTQAWHEPRALWAFEHVGFQAVPWPAPHQSFKIDSIDDFLPSADALHDSYLAFHELIGAAYYRLRY